MTPRNRRVLCGSLLLAGTCLNAQAAPAPSALSFNRIATLANYTNNNDPADSTVSEIIAATANGRTLVYTDGALGQIGLIDISSPTQPMPAGKIDVGGEPTSVDVRGNNLALVAVNTSPSFTTPSGKLVVVNLNTQSIVAEHDLGGQPDSLKISKDGRYAAIAIENERDEEVVVSEVEGGLPQAPAGYLVIMDLVGGPNAWTRRDVDLTGLAAYAGDDPEPEFVDINESNQAVVTMQENNHLVIVDLASGTIVNDFGAGTVSLFGVDNNEDGVISLMDSVTGIPREPDAVAWVSGGSGQAPLIATANEGDLFGGSRGFSLFNQAGNLVYDSGNAFEHIAVRHGHYPEDRSENKGSEPEAVAAGNYGGQEYLFVGSERGSFVAVYKVVGGVPQFSQLLPAPLGPEGLLTIPSRNLLVVSGEEDDPEFGVRSSVMIYRLNGAAPSYPQITSVNQGGLPIAWSALSGMVAVPNRGNELLAVWDSYYSQSRIFTLDAGAKPARITRAIDITGGSGDYDPEGIAIAPDDTLWVASEGNASDSRPNRLLQLDPNGTVINEIGLPAEILACRAASTATGTLGSGFEGVAITLAKTGYRVLVAQQRGWDYTTPECEALDDDDGGLNANGEPNNTRIWVYYPERNRWSHVSWELAPLPGDASWVGLSEITTTPDGDFLVLERDNRTGDFAALKTLVQVRRTAMFPDRVVTAGEKAVFDMLPALKATKGLVTDKPEGVAVTDNGRVFVVTDNDGVEDWSGETWFLRLGSLSGLFR